MAMGVITRSKKRRMEEEERLADRISGLPDDVLGDIVSLLPTKGAARTQVLSSHWRHIWRSAPLNLDLHLHDSGRSIPVDEVSRVLSAHPGPGRHFSIPKDYLKHLKDPEQRSIPMDDWLQCPALQNLHELHINSNVPSWARQPPPQPASMHRFSSTLRIASFGGFEFPDGTDNAKALHLPLLEQLTLSDVSISEGSLQAMLAGCSLLQSLLLLDSYGFRTLRIVSPSLRSIGVRSSPYGVKLKLDELLVVDAPYLQRLLFFERTKMHILVVIFSAPRLDIYGEFFDNYPKIVRQGTTEDSMIQSVKVLALCDVQLSLDSAIGLLKYFPNLEKLYIKATSACVENAWYDKYRKLIGTLDIRLRKIVLINYQGNKSHINFAKFYVYTAKVLESMVLESGVGNISKDWVARQRRLLNIKKRASRGARFSFASPKILTGSLDVLHAEQVHDLSTTDPFQRFHY